MSEQKTHYGRLLKALVDRTGTQSAIAGKVGVSQSTLSGYFSAEAPSVDTFMRVCEACGTSAWKVLATEESGLDPVLFRVIDLIIHFPAAERTYVFKGIERDVEYLVTRRKKTVDAPEE